MKTLPWINRLVRIYCITCGLSLGVSTLAQAETLMGVVKQPEAPYHPAPGSAVTVYDKSTSAPVAGPDTTDSQGRYQFSVPRGKQVVVKASWKLELSSPGSTEAKIVKNPTQADVQLLPAKGAPPEQWMTLGKQSPALTMESSADVLRTLRESKVPPESIYSYLLGIREKNPDAFKDLNNLGLFTRVNPSLVVNAIKVTDQQYKRTSTVPTFQQIRLVGNGLSEADHIQLLGFVATNVQDKSRWNAALEKSLGKEDKEKVSKEDLIIDYSVFGKPK